MKAKELKVLVNAMDDDATVELDVDIFSSIGADRNSRQTRRILEVRFSKGAKVWYITGDGNLRSQEEKMLDEGLYNRAYNDFEAHWDGVSRDVRKEMMMKADLIGAGLMWPRYVDHDWAALSLLIQQMIMVRNELPVAVPA